MESATGESPFGQTADQNIDPYPVWPPASAEPSLANAQVQLGQALALALPEARGP